MKTNYKKIGGIDNYYGGLMIKEEDGKYYWIIEDYDTDFSDLSRWEEITKELYTQLLKHQENYENKRKY